jgi:hypothetical protein
MSYVKGELSVVSDVADSIGPTISVGLSCDGRAAVLVLRPFHADVLITLLQRGLRNLNNGECISEHLITIGSTIRILP